MVVTPRDFKKGMIIELEGGLWIVEDFHIQGTAQRKPVVECRLRNVRTGRVVERSLDEHMSVESPETETRNAQYLYFDGEKHVFMDTETYDQFEVDAALVEGHEWLLKDGAEFPVRFVQGEPVQVIFPHHVVEEVVETAEPAAGGSTNVWKEAKLASGIVIQVPQHIKVGDHVKVEVATREYMGKESK